VKIGNSEWAMSPFGRVSGFMGFLIGLLAACLGGFALIAMRQPLLPEKEPEPRQALPAL
jgi:hypothetical protein